MHIPAKLSMKIILFNESLLIFSLPNFGWKERSIIVQIDGNLARILIFNGVEALRTCTIGLVEV